VLVTSFQPILLALMPFSIPVNGKGRFIFESSIQLAFNVRAPSPPLPPDNTNSLGDNLILMNHQHLL
jgi:hypothetical protein